MTTTVTVEVPQTMYNVLATSTPDVSLWQEIINYLLSWI